MIVKSVLFFLILITIIYVYQGQRSQDELIIKLEKDIVDLKLSIELKIKQIINQVINQDTINNIKIQISQDVDNIIKKQFEINKAKFNQSQITSSLKEEIIKNTQKQIKSQIDIAINQFKINEFNPKLSKLEEKLNKAINKITATINAVIVKYKTTILVN